MSDVGSKVSSQKTLLTLEEILQATGGVHVLGEEPFFFTSVQCDSRLVEKGSLFIPLIGENQDGHKYIDKAIEKGASSILICMKNFEEEGETFTSLFKKKPSVNFIAVENTLIALQKAAACYVEKFPHLIKIGVTGSSGKTTAKEILVSILSQKYNVISNKGNLNSETGLPLSVFNIRSEHECGVFEMGMNRENEIGEIAFVLKPRFALVTNIGTAHIGKLGSRENIAKEKSKIFSYFNGFGTGVIPFDDDFTDFMKNEIEGKVVLYGEESENIKYIASLGLEGTKMSIGGKETVLHLPGKYNYKNALGAIALCEVLGLSYDEISKGISSVKPLFGRSEIIKGKYTVIQDCYNANPLSMKEAIEFASSIEVEEGAKKIFVLGDMLEIGDETKNQHKKIGEFAIKSNVDLIIFIGKEIKSAFEEAEKEKESNLNQSNLKTKEVVFIEGKDLSSIEDAALKIKYFAPENKGSLILIKGSRAMGLERLTKLLLGEKL